MQLCGNISRQKCPLHSLSLTCVCISQVHEIGNCVTLLKRVLHKNEAVPRFISGYGTT